MAEDDDERYPSENKRRVPLCILFKDARYLSLFFYFKLTLALLNFLERFWQTEELNLEKRMYEQQVVS